MLKYIFFKSGDIIVTRAAHFVITDPGFVKGALNLATPEDLVNSILG